MNRLIVFIAACVAMMSAANVFAAIITQPTSLNPGDKYRLAFVTSGILHATSSDIADYNTFVTNAANAVPALASLGTTWTVIGSTATVDARDNTNTVPSTVTGGSLGVPIFLLNDTKLVDSNDDLWDGFIGLPFGRTEVDTSLNAPTWTGTDPSGTAGAAPLGFTIVTIGASSTTSSQWIDMMTLSHTFVPRPLYALSGELPGIPVPVALADLDIKPGSDQNPVNLGSNGVLPVAILTTNDFDALGVDIGTILFGDPVLLDDDGIGVAPVHSAEEDVDGDGLIDLTLKFSISELIDNGALGNMSVEAILTGATLGGTPFEGADSIRLLPPGDANNDQIVNAADYTIWASGFGTPSPDLSDGDFNEDHKVDASDYTMWANNVGTDLSAPGSAATAVPEPSTFVLSAFGLIGLLAYRWQRRRRA